MNNIGLYIHIPFCKSKCNYCNFYSINGTADTYESYINSVIKEIEYWKHSELQNKHIDTIYIGGGTPSVLGTDLLQKLLIYTTENLNIANDVEITMEVNPVSVSNVNLSSLKAYGLNRISMGLQSSNDDELKLLGRLHTVYDAEKSIELFYKTGIENFSLDVMQGIPLQTAESLDKTLDFCINSGAKHISTYMLKIEKDTPFYENPNKLIFADEDTQADLYEFTCRKLANNKFRHYEISNFCIDNKVSKHNMKYWLLEDYLGIGPSAHSLINNKRFYYPSDISEFSTNNIEFESYGKTPNEYIMLSLRTDSGFIYKKYNELFNSTLSPDFSDKVKYFEKLGFIKVTEDAVILTEKGYLLSNTIISQLINTGI